MCPMQGLLLMLACCILLGQTGGQQSAAAPAPIYQSFTPGSLNGSLNSAARIQGSSQGSSVQWSASIPPQGESASSAARPSQSQNLCTQPGSTSLPWGILAIKADQGSTLPPRTDHVMVCMVSTGVLASSPLFSQNNWSGCPREDPSDPGGCALTWSSPTDNQGVFRPRATYAAAVMAAKPGIVPGVQGVIPNGTDFYVIPADVSTGTIDPSSKALGGKSRIRAYSVCEGRLRGLQAQESGNNPPRPPWRMVVFVDVAATGHAAPIGTSVMQITEADWFQTATGFREGGQPPDVLVVAPAGDNASSMAFPAAFKQVLAVGACNCQGAPVKGYAGTKGRPDILAPGKSVVVPNIQQSGSVSGTKVWEGSSAAAAYVAGAAARLWSAYSKCNANEIRQALVAGQSKDSSIPPRLDLQQATQHLSSIGCGKQ
eukprot:GHRR01013047.1.p1 GENE.GHRR01013047.1~~GHRR01013047.1.p1  ORF type:complete len:429 (+),score=129.11 GHRR01013047.1:239-1525(+)